MKFLNRRFAASLLVLPLLLLAACGGSSSTPAATVTGLSLAATSAPLLVGAGTQLTATATYSDGTTQDVTSSATYVSSAPSKATVSAAGLVTAVAVGTVRITASYSGKSAFKDLTVSVVAPTLTSIAITTSPASVALGSTLPLTVTGTYSDSSTHDVTSTSTFTSSATAVATVTSPGGVVSGLTVGTTTITATNSGKTANKDVSVTAVVAPGANQIVFYDGYGTNVAFKDFGGAANNVTIDPTETFNGRKVINFQVTGTGGYSGGAWYTTAPRDLSAYNAVTFYAKASVVNTLNVVGFGNDGGAASGTPFPTERNALPITTAWQKFTVPVPAPARYLNVGGLFHIADAPDGYTLFLADIVYESLSSGVLGTGSASINLSSVAPTLGIGDHANVDPIQSQVSYTVAGDPQGTFNVTPVANAFFDFTSSTPAVASVTPAGLITALSGGSTNITATLGGVAASGSYPITVTSIPVPGTLPPLPAPPAGSSVISLYASQAGGFTGSTVTDKSGNVDTWLTCWSQSNNPTAGGNPFAVTVGADTANPRKYVFGSAGASYGGVDFLGFSAGGTSCDNPPTANGTHTIDISGMTHFHIDVWTPNANNVQVKLVNTNPATNWSELTNANATLNGLNPPNYPAFGTGTWLSYDIPLNISPTSFQNGNFGAASTLTHLGQMVFTVPNGGTIYVDNMYFYGGAGGGGGGTTPTAAPAAPTALPANVISLFSSAYTGGTAGGDFSARVDSYNATCFGPPGNTVADYVIAAGSHTVKQYTMAANSFGIIETIGATGGTAVPPDSAICNGGTQSGANLIDATAMTTIHFDVWSATGSTNFQVQLVNVDAGTLSGPGQGTGSTGGTQFSSGANVVPAGTWTGFDIALSSLGPAGAPAGLNKLGLVKFFTTDGGVFFIDNLYFSHPTPPPPPPDFTTITYDGAGTTYEFGGFGGASGSLVVDPDPAAPTNHVAKLVKPGGAQTWAGVSLGVNGLAGFAAGKIPFSATSTTMTVRVYAPAAGLPVLLKVENSGNGGISSEVQASTTVANAWETLTFTLPTVNLANTYDKVSLFPHFNTSPGADETWYFDDLTFVP